MLLPRSSQQSIHQREVELTLGRLDQFPAHRRHNSIQSHRCQPRPLRIHIVQARRARVMDLGAQHQIRLAIHDQLRSVATLFQMRRTSLPRTSLPIDRPSGSAEKERKSRERKKTVFHGTQNLSLRRPLRPARYLVSRSQQPWDHAAIRVTLHLQMKLLAQSARCCCCR